MRSDGLTAGTRTTHSYCTICTAKKFHTNRKEIIISFCFRNVYLSLEMFYRKFGKNAPGHFAPCKFRSSYSGVWIVSQKLKLFIKKFKKIKHISVIKIWADNPIVCYKAPHHLVVSLTVSHKGTECGCDKVQRTAQIRLIRYVTIYSIFSS